MPRLDQNPVSIEAPSIMKFAQIALFEWSKDSIAIQNFIAILCSLVTSKWTLELRRKFRLLLFLTDYVKPAVFFNKFYQYRACFLFFFDAPRDGNFSLNFLLNLRSQILHQCEIGILLSFFNHPLL